MGKARVRKALAGLVVAGAVLGSASGVAGAIETSDWLRSPIGNSGATTPSIAKPLRPISVETVAQKTDRQVREMINAVRATGTVCRGVAMPAVPALAANEQLRVAAEGHSKEQAATGVMTHDGVNGSTFVQRVKAAGYTAFAASETVAAGYQTPRAVVDGWLASPSGHCEYLMAANVNEVGIASATNPNSTYGIYWTADFGRR